MAGSWQDRDSPFGSIWSTSVCTLWLVGGMGSWTLKEQFRYLTSFWFSRLLVWSATKTAVLPFDIINNFVKKAKKKQCRTSWLAAGRGVVQPTADRRRGVGCRSLQSRDNSLRPVNNSSFRKVLPKWPRPLDDGRQPQQPTSDLRKDF